MKPMMRRRPTPSPTPQAAPTGKSLRSPPMVLRRALGTITPATSTRVAARPRASRIRRQGLRRRRGVGLVVDARPTPRTAGRAPRVATPRRRGVRRGGPRSGRGCRGSRRPPLPGPATRSSRRCAHRAAAGEGRFEGGQGSVTHEDPVGAGRPSSTSGARPVTTWTPAPRRQRWPPPGPPLRVSPRPPSRSAQGARVPIRCRRCRRRRHPRARRRVAAAACRARRRAPRPS